MTGDARESRRIVVVARVLGLSLTIGAVLIAAIIVVLRVTDNTPAATAAAPITTGCDPNATALPIMVLGDSYSNGLDIILEAVLCNTGIARNVQVSTVINGGETLAGHYSDADSAKFTGHKIIVLQDQSQVPGLGTSHPEFQASLLAVGLLGADATRAGARIVLFQTWGHENGDPPPNAQIFPDYDTMQARLDAGYADYLADLRAGVAPDATLATVGDAFAWLKVRDPGLFGALYAADGSHPSSIGTYLSALVLAQQISQTVLPAASVWAPPGLPARTALLLQQAARSVWRS